MIDKEAILKKQHDSKNNKIYLAPVCSLCGFILFIQEDGVIIHSKNELCINSGKKYKFCSSEPEKGSYSKNWLYKTYKSIAIMEEG